MVLKRGKGLSVDDYLLDCYVKGCLSFLVLDIYIHGFLQLNQSQKLQLLLINNNSDKEIIRAKKMSHKVSYY